MTKLTAAVEHYLTDLRRVRASGGATGERSIYGPLANLLNDVGATLKPKVFCVGELADQGAGHPDFGLYSAKQVQRGRPREGQTPERGVVEVKSAGDDAWLTAAGPQVSRYWDRYRLVLVTNTRDFVLLGADPSGRAIRLETFRLADSAEDFDRLLEKPRAFARRVGAGLGEYLCRALSHSATLSEPKDLAWLLASYARDGLARVDEAGDSPALAAVRSALEDALGVRFEGERGAAFFRSTLVQTLFYGVFSAWVLWARQMPPPTGSFNWHEAVWHLRAPVLRALFQQLSDPGRLRPLGLVEVLDWTAAALDRVDQEAFFTRFDASMSPSGSGSEAVPYFYEPFLEAFDPRLRKELGVWYTPNEVVRYMVARVDRALKDDLGIADGLAADNVYVLDPCCGTGAYLAEVLRRIAENLKRPGPRRPHRRESQAGRNRASVRLRDHAGPVRHRPPAGRPHHAGPRCSPRRRRKRARRRIPHQRPHRLGEDGAAAGLADPRAGGRARTRRPGEARQGRSLSSSAIRPTTALPAWRSTRSANCRKPTARPSGCADPKARDLNDLYVRFFRMAERRIAEKTGQGIVCFISNYSWLDGLSFTGMRERYLEAFDAIRIDCLNGDKYKTGKTTPDGSPDPSIFSTPEDPVGIQVGTAIATLVRKTDHAPAETIDFRHLWGQEPSASSLPKRPRPSQPRYTTPIAPVLPLGLPFARLAVSDWLVRLAGPAGFNSLASFPGVKSGRDSVCRRY